jgi:hypothetical protein
MKLRNKCAMIVICTITAVGFHSCDCADDDELRRLEKEKLEENRRFSGENRPDHQLNPNLH